MRIYISSFLYILFTGLFCAVKVFSKTDAHKSATFLKNGFLKSQETGMFGKKRSNIKDLYTTLESVQFKAYRPKLFQLLRTHAGVDDTSYYNCLDSNKLECISSDSKSGAAFWKSIDDSVVIKTIRKYECNNMKKMMDSYAEHILGGHSCISRVLGLYRVRIKSGKTTYFLVSKNVYKHSSPDANMTRTYDLKGSTVNRLKSPTSNVCKDLDLLNSGHKLQLGRAKTSLMRVLSRDVEFLRRQGVMDYSVLVQEESTSPSGFKRFMHRMLNPKIVQPVLDRGKFILLGDDGTTYHFGIIDFLQQYSLRKFLETLIKGLYCDRTAISCVAPERYARRLVRFVDEVTV